jgi:hypothetical protein
MVQQPLRVDDNVNIDIWQVSPLTALMNALQGPSDQERAQRRLLKTQEDLRAILSVERWELDLGAPVLELKHLLPAQEVHRSELILNEPTFKAFAQDHKSCSLLIQGDTDVVRITPISGITLFSASLYQSLAAYGGRYRPLVFFCGNHTFESDPSSGGAGLFRCLILQLLALESFSTADFLQHVDPLKVEAGHLETLRKVFIMLLKQLPGDLTIFCIIDGVNYYENNHFEFGMRVAIDCLVGMAEDYDIQAAVKVLVTGVVPTKSIGTHPHFETGLHVLDMADMDDDEDEDYVQDDGEKRPPLSKTVLGVRIAETFGL